MLDFFFFSVKRGGGGEKKERKKKKCQKYYLIQSQNLKTLAIKICFKAQNICG